MTDLPDAADRAHNAPYSEQANAEMQRVYAENERLHRIVDRLTDRLGELHDAGLDASEDAVDWRARAVDWRQRAVDQEREAARLRAERNEALEDNLRLLGELGRARKWSAVWKRAAKRHRAGRHLAARMFAEWLRRGVNADEEWDNLHAAYNASQDALREAQDQLSAAHDEIRRLREGLLEWRSDYYRVLSKLLEARAERDALQAQLDAGLDDCLEMHAAFVAVKRERDKLRAIIGEGAL